MKKIIYLFLAVTMTAFLFGCADDNKNNDNAGGSAPVCKNGVVCPEEQPKTEKGKPQEFKLTFTNTTGKGNRLQAEIYLPDDKMFKFSPAGSKKCDVVQRGSTVMIARYDDNNETPICEVSYTFTAPQDANANTDLTGKYILFTGDQVPAPTEPFTVKHPLVGQIKPDVPTTPVTELVNISPAPKDNVITLQPTSDGKYVLTFTNGTLVNGNATAESSDVFFQFDWDLNGINPYDKSIELIKSETTCPGRETLFYSRLDKHPDRRTCKITYKLNNNKKDMFMKRFIVIKNPEPNHDYDLDNTQGETITIKHQESNTSPDGNNQGGNQGNNQDSLDGLIIDPAPQGKVITHSPTTDGTYTLTFTNENQPIPNTKIDVLYFQFDVNMISIGAELIEDKTTCRFDSPNSDGKRRFYQNLRKIKESCKITYRLNGSKKDMLLEQFVTKRIFDPKDTELDMLKAQNMTVKHP